MKLKNKFIVISCALSITSITFAAKGPKDDDEDDYVELMISNDILGLQKLQTASASCSSSSNNTSSANPASAGFSGIGQSIGFQAAQVVQETLLGSKNQSGQPVPGAVEQLVKGVQNMHMEHGHCHSIDMPSSVTALRISGLIGLGGALISIANNGPTKSNMGVAVASSTFIYNYQIQNAALSFANKRVQKIVFGS